MASRQNKTRSRSCKYKYLISACLAGADCTYNGNNKLRTQLLDMVRDGSALAVCPEVMGGSSIPREQCEILSGEGKDVLLGKSFVKTISGKDVTGNMISGAKKTLKLARTFGIKRAILKSKSPSCGCGLIYDGTFKGKLRRGNGVTAELLLKNKILVFTEKEGRLWPAKSI